MARFRGKRKLCGCNGNRNKEQSHEIYPPLGDLKPIMDDSDFLRRRSKSKKDGID
jgi:hypothetical protein